jgi:hypothetical protein
VNRKRPDGSLVRVARICNASRQARQTPVRLIDGTPENVISRIADIDESAGGIRNKVANNMDVENGGPGTSVKAPVEELMANAAIFSRRMPK